MEEAPPPLSGRFQAAVARARRLHGSQRRLGTEIPYMAHLLVVTGLVLEDGGDETEAIAALLHDAVDEGAELDAIAAEFGPRVADIVRRCSDVVDDDGGPWVARKQRYLEHLKGEHDPSVLRVALADKVHNARSIVRDYRAEGHVLWERFGRRTAHDQLWFYTGLLKLFVERCHGPLTEDLRRAVLELGELAAADDAGDRGSLRLWVDHDFHDRPAPAGWIQVPTARQAIALLSAGRVAALSCAADLDDGAPGRPVIDWLVAHYSPAEGVPWPEELVALHAVADGDGWAEAGELRPPQWTPAGGGPA